MSWLDALGWAGSALLIFSVMQARLIRLRALNLVACVVLTVFNALIGVWPMVAMNVALAAINLWFLAGLLRRRHDDDAFDVLQVAPSDSYLRHLLRVHGDDIRRFQPDFSESVLTDDLTSYLILHGDESVGVVVLRPAGGGTANLILDYVTPRYRDFTPGEFVWRRSGLLRESGFDRVVTSPTMVGPYYETLGFRREGESFVLEMQ